MYSPGLGRLTRPSTSQTRLSSAVALTRPSTSVSSRNPQWRESQGAWEQWRASSAARQSLAQMGKQEVLRRVLDGCADMILGHRPGSPPGDESAFELPNDDDEEEELQENSEWRAHAKPRAAGVKALQSLAVRHTQAVAEKELCASMAKEAQMETVELQRQVVQVQEALRVLTEEQRSTAAALREAQAREQASASAHTTEVELLRKRADQDRRQLDAEVEGVRKQLESCGKSLQDTQAQLLQTENQLREAQVELKEQKRLNAALLADASAQTLRREELESELAKMRASAAYARRKLPAVDDWTHRQQELRKHEIRVREERIARLETWFKELKVQNSVLDASLAEEKKTLHTTDEGWKDKFGAMEHDFTEKVNILTAEVEKRGRKIEKLSRALKEAEVNAKWCWLLAMAQISLRFSYKAEAQTQSSHPILGDYVEKIVQTTEVRGVALDGDKAAGGQTAHLVKGVLRGMTLPQGVNLPHYLEVTEPSAIPNEVFKKFVVVWGRLVVKALSLEEEEVRKIRMPARELLYKISRFYSRKIVMDQVDDSNHRPRQHLAHFVYDLCLAEAGSAQAGFDAALQLVANVIQYFPRPEPPREQGQPELDDELPEGAHMSWSAFDSPEGGWAKELQVLAAEETSKVRKEHRTLGAAMFGLGDLGSPVQRFGRSPSPGHEHDKKPPQAPARRGSVAHLNQLSGPGPGPGPAPGPVVPHSQAAPGAAAALALSPAVAPAVEGPAPAAGRAGRRPSVVFEGAGGGRRPGSPQPRGSARRHSNSPDAHPSPLTSPVPYVNPKRRKTFRKRAVLWCQEQGVSNSQVRRIEMFARLVGVNCNSKWDLEMQQEGADVYLEALVRVRRGFTPLLSTESHRENEMVKLADWLNTLDMVCGRVRRVDRERIKTKMSHGLPEVYKGAPHLHIDQALELLVAFWKETVHDHIDARLQSLFVANDTDKNGELDYGEFGNMVNKLRVEGYESVPQRQVLRMYSQMSLASRVDASVFASVARMFQLGKIKVGVLAGADHGPSEQELDAVWRMLGLQWRLLEHKTAPVIVAMSGTVQGQQIEEETDLLRQLIRERREPEKAVHVYRMLVKDLPDKMKSEMQME